MRTWASCSCSATRTAATWWWSAALGSSGRGATGRAAVRLAQGRCSTLCTSSGCHKSSCLPWSHRKCWSCWIAHRLISVCWRIHWLHSHLGVKVSWSHPATSRCASLRSHLPRATVSTRPCHWPWKSRPCLVVWEPSRWTTWFPGWLVRMTGSGCSARSVS